MSFDNAFAWILEIEKGYSDSATDLGGETKYGISKRSYPLLDIKNLTIEAAKSIYLRDFWNPCVCSKMPTALAIAVFDCAVNEAPHIAILLLQQALLKQKIAVEIDGICGTKTIAAIDKANQGELLVMYLALRGMRYARTKTLDANGLGWYSRLIRLSIFIERL